MKTLTVEQRLSQVSELSCATSEAIRELREFAGSQAERIAGVERRLGFGAPSSGWRDFGEFLTAVRRAAASRTDRRLQERTASGLVEDGSPDVGGFIVPADFSNVLAEMVSYAAPVSSRCMRIGSKSRTLNLPAIDETSRANGSRWGGVVSGWENEGDLLPIGKPEFRKLQLAVRKLATAVYVTDELTEDGALSTWVARAFTAEASHVMDDVVVGGSGVGQPLGIINAPATIVVPAVAGQTAGTIVPQNVASMLARILPECLESSVWLMSTDMLASLYMSPLVAGSDTSVSVTNLFTAPDAAAPYGRLMTRPVLPVEQASAIGTVGDIILADLSKYIILERPLDIKLSMHVRFVNGEGVYRFTYRVDGQPLYYSAITPKTGGPTKSAFVTLAQR